MIKYTLRALAALAAAALISFSAPAQTSRLERVTPESQGLLSAPLMEFFDSMMVYPATEIHGIVVMRHGKVVAEVYPKPFEVTYGHTLYSCSKTFVSAAAGIAMGENRLRLDDRVATFFPECLPDSVSAELAQMTVRHLLTMTSGVTPDWQMRSVCDDWIRTFLAKPVSAPGEKFQYDSMCTYLLAAIVERVTGMRLLDYLNLHVFTALGVTDAQWELSPEGHNTGGWGLRLQCESMAKFGQLLLQEGCWEGRQLIPRQWVKTMCERHADGGTDGYGYQIWMCERPLTTRADGAFGQFIYVIPDKDMVVAVTQCSKLNSAVQRRLLWRVIDEATVHDVDGVSAPLPESSDTRELARRQASYVLPVAEGRATQKYSGRLVGHTLALGPNKYGWKTLRIESGEKSLALTLTDAQGLATRIACGYGQWMTVENTTPPVYSITARGRFDGISGPYRVAGSYGWGTDGLLRVKVKFVDWITPLDIAVNPTGNGAVIEIRELCQNEKIVVNAEYK